MNRTFAASMLLASLNLSATACDRGQAPSADPETTPLQARPATSPAPVAVAPQPTPAPEPTVEVRAEALVTTVEALGALHVTHAADCGALATALEGFHSEHATQLSQAPASVHAWIDGNKALSTRLGAALEPVMTTAMGCRSHAEFAAMQTRLFGPAPAGSEPVAADSDHDEPTPSAG